MILAALLPVILPMHLLSMAGANVFSQKDAQERIDYYGNNASIQLHGTYSPKNPHLSRQQRNYLVLRREECNGGVNNGSSFQNMIKHFTFTTEPHQVYIEYCNVGECNGHDLLGPNNEPIVLCGKVYCKLARSMRTVLGFFTKQSVLSAGILFGGCFLLYRAKYHTAVKVS